MNLLVAEPLVASPHSEPRAHSRPEAASARPSTPWHHHAAAAALLGVVFSVTFALGVRHNDFPLYYHEDEQSKVAQVTSDTRNYNHPQLLLEVSQWAWRAMGRPNDEREAVRIGRGVSAAFGALAAVAAAAAFYRVAGLAGLAVGGAAVGLCPALLVYGHYMKEDAALALGVSLTALAAQVVWARRVRPVDWWGTSVLGAACAVAASAKFAGTFTVVVCVPLVWVASRPGWRRRASGLAVFAAAFVLVVAAVNHRALHEPRRALATMEREHQHATTRHRAFTMARPNLFHAAAAVRQTMPHVLVLALGFVAYAAARPWGAGGWGVFLAAFMVAYLAVLSWSVLPYYRYALPVVLLAHWLMALAVVRVVQGWAPPRARAAWLATAAVGVVALQLPRCLDYTRQFGDDSRDRLRLWATQHLPADAVFVQDGCVALDAPFDRRTGVTEQPQFLVYGPASYDDAPAASAGLLKDLRRMGVGYVAVSDFAFYRYFDPSVRPAPDSRAVFESRRRWYEELFREHELIWSSVPAHPTHSHFNNPELKLYRLRDPARNGGAK